ncbi:EnvZ/OmpR regulon moderator MzrA [Pantoea sp. JGM49]|uniref:EnvZ/OmpR regulon moderator MzrA n=1 Tax=unclassified Pantoea TaxID=2630326 RepID=UPI001BA66754|nr:MULTISPECIES: EnvZ/OmpR regulon moderator MzrA [unclassified Pantoea]MBS0881031.1 EnvZ/OmpR regulon moderator MzrA [Pantoea sp. JGM49]MDI9279332.1 EnvZ/OmpR regulon moderator MzrA [Pantoea sp. EABMAA-21]
MIRFRGFPRRFVPWALGAALALLAVIFVPSMLQHDTVVQIRVAHNGTNLPDGFYLYQQLSAQGVRIKSITPAGDALLIHFENEEQSLAAQKVLKRLLPQGFVVASGPQASQQVPDSNRPTYS